MTSALDFSYARPTPQEILGAGVKGVLVYTGNARPDQGYIDSLRSAGITVTFIMETYSQRSQAGFQAGVLDCQFAEQRARERGHNGSIAVVVSDGNGADNWDASQYGAGWQSVATLPFFSYGAQPICESFNRGAPRSLGTWVPSTWGQGTLMSQLVVQSPVAGTDLNTVHADYTGGTVPVPPTAKDDDMPLYITKKSDTSVGVWVTDSQTRRWVGPEEWAFAQFVGQKLVPISDTWWNELPDINAGGSAPVPGPITLKGTWSTV